ncbi:MAG TPA: UDP-N-acetylmuramoyl-L-alanine--D-glutamate ligase [bacterium]|nr:UDP-N-acetylmuramoyl-L-alanine--D-glutamate ligase [Myxococcales bacterium]HQG13203.1 UDP-N-acetylmuramoyl-L-alanine--D-glutamate ligase [bacterium]
MNFRGKKIVVVGLGKSGIAAARFLAREGAVVTALDSKPQAEMENAILSLKDVGVSLRFGGNDPAVISSSDMAVISPGVSPSLEGLEDICRRGGAVVGEMELAVGRIDRPIVAVTGTNGKTTTTSLIGHLLENSGIRRVVAGNIGTPILDLVDDANRSDAVILEVSSFQIETTPSLAPKISVLLNITPDHLDRHASFEEYAECKGTLVKRTVADGFGIYNVRDALVSRIVRGATCSLIPFDAEGGSHLKSGSAASWFDGEALMVSSGGGITRKYSLEGISLEGVHNRENMLAALTVCELLGADSDLLLEGLKSFKGLPHRMELVRDFDGVRYFNDSKGTNIGAVAKAISSLDAPIILIAGGISKGVDFSPLSSLVEEKVKKLVLIGESCEEMSRIFEGIADITRASSMREAVLIAASVAEPGDVVLLSPACASFDMFRNYADRGEQFAKCVMELADEK